MSENRDFGFCPRCGALMQDGVCQSCGRGMGRQPQQFENYGTQSSMGMQGNMSYIPNDSGVTGGPGTGPAYVHIAPVKQKNHTVVIVISVTTAILLLLAALTALIVFIGNSAKDSINSGGHRDYYDDDYYGEYDDEYDYGYYEPSEDDPYYEEIVDWTRTDLDYQLQWVVESVDPDNSEDSCTYYTTYPILEKDGTDRFDGINEVLRNLALSYRDSYKDYDGGVSTFGYVTFMDEEKISVAFKHNFYGEDVTEVRLDACSFWIETGKEITPEEMTDLDRELAMRFQSQDKLQNDGVEYVQKLTAEELLEILKNPKRAVFFYTPVGLEVGFNYETGWVTVTIKEQAL